MDFAQKALKDVTLFPFWLDSKDAPHVTTELIGRTEADLVIVGGGFTGLWAAILAKETNRECDVVLIEGGKVAYGASGRPGAIVSTSLMHGLRNAVRIFPKDIAELEQLSKDNMEGFLDSLKRYNIDAHQNWGGELTVAIGDGRIRDIEDEYELHRRYGHDVTLLNKEQIKAEVNSPLYSAAVWNKKQSGTVHPVRLAWGLKAAAVKLGVRLHEYSPMESVEDLGTSIVIRTHDGAVRSPKVLLCTNAFAAGHSHIKRRVVAIRDRIVATEPLKKDQLDGIGWNNRQGVYDTRTQMNYMRMTKDNRIIFGGRLAYYYGGNTDPCGDRIVKPYFRLADAFQKTFPQLSDIRFTHAWGGPIALTTRMAVHFQEYYNGKMVWAGGYSGFGVSASRFGARIGLAKLEKSNSAETKLDFATTMPNRVPPEPFRWIGSKITLYALDTADEKGGWRNLWIKFIHSLGFPL